jgi:hypothetical protein
MGSVRLKWPVERVDQLRELAEVRGLTCTRIAEEMRMGRDSVLNACSRYGIDLPGGHGRSVYLNALVSDRTKAKLERISTPEEIASRFPPGSLDRRRAA